MQPIPSLFGGYNLCLPYSSEQSRHRISNRKKYMPYMTFIVAILI